MPQKKLNEFKNAVIGALNVISSTQDDSALRPRIRALATAMNRGETNLAELARAILSARPELSKQRK
ncbi:MAG TPA: hypothetical protein VMV71_03160 [Candidatus Paceibacterota bacterium]|nr:hypothetical protein [Candidatus Paceibacterota bacterium]